MSNLLHPGLILVATGFACLVAPAAVRGILMVLGALASLFAVYNLPLGTDLVLNFPGNFELHYLFVDKLGWLFALIFAMITLVGAIYSMHNKNRMEALCAMGYAGCAIGVTLANDWLTMIFFWEALAATSLFLIWCNNTPTSRKAGFRYLLVHLFGGNLLLLGILLKMNQGEYLITNLASGPWDCAFWLILGGVAVNAAIPPVNAWLVDGYSESTITGSVFLSSFTTKVAVFCLIRIFGGADILMWLGVFMALHGACYAVMENDMRRLLSYHIISQLGFMVAAAGVGSELGLNGAAAHAFTNILNKSLLFMCAGAIMYSTGISKINRLGGMLKRLPLVAICFFVAAFAISGVPGFSGFVSKTMAINSAYLGGFGDVYTLLELASMGTFLSVSLKMGYFIFIKDSKEEIVCEKLPCNMCVAMCLQAVLCIAYGLCPNLLYDYLPYATDFKPYDPANILQYIQVLTVVAVPFVMYLPKMEPHTAISLDTDWFYRKPFGGLVSWVSGLLCALCSAFGAGWQYLYDVFIGCTSNPMKFLDSKPIYDEESYNPNNYRTAIGEPIMIILTVLVMAIGWFMFIL